MAAVDHDSNMENALDELGTEHPLSLCTAAEKWGVKKSTLWDRKKGVKPRQQGQSALQLLSPNQVSTANSVDSHCRWQKTYRRCTILQELILIEWINHLGMLGQPLESRTINPYVQDLCG
jgi:hypothetical protein